MGKGANCSIHIIFIIKSLMGWIEHGSCVVVLNCILSRLKLLFFYEFFMSSRILNIRTRISSMVGQVRVVAVRHNHLHWLTCLWLALLLVGYLSTLAIVVHEYNVALVYTPGVRAAMRSLFIASTHISILSITHPHWVATHVLILWLIKVEDVSLSLLAVGSCGCNTSWGLHDINGPIDAVHLTDLLSVSVSHKCFIVCVQFQLFW